MKIDQVYNLIWAFIKRKLLVNCSTKLKFYPLSKNKPCLVYMKSVNDIVLYMVSL